MPETRKPVNAADLRNLPLLAIVAFAARCARRAVPLFLLGNVSPTKSRDAKVLLRAICYAEVIANGGQTTGEYGTPSVEIGYQAAGSAACAAFIAGQAAHCADWATGLGVFPEA